MEPNFWEASDKNIEQYKADSIFLVVQDIYKELGSYSTLEFVDKKALAHRVCRTLMDSLSIRGMERALKVRSKLNSKIISLNKEIRVTQQMLNVQKQLYKIHSQLAVNATNREIRVRNRSRELYLKAKTKLKMLIKLRKELREIYNTPRTT